MDRRPPFKLAVAALLLDDIARTPAAVLADLAGEYGGNRPLVRANVEAALQSLKAVGIVTTVTDSEAQEPAYSLTRNGKNKVVNAL
jgi:hypothetical protein